MRINPDHVRLRVVAMVCWVLAAWWIIQFGSLLSVSPPWLVVAVALGGIVFLAVGIAFWELGTDRRAGVMLDDKGVMLNMGNYAAFITWENIAAVGVTPYRGTLLFLGSSRQLGIRLNDAEAYIQSYEERLPASHGPLGWMLRRIEGLLRSLHQHDRAPTLEGLAQIRTRTGYDVVIPETLLGGTAEAFAQLLEVYQVNRTRRYELRQFELDRAA